MTNPAKSKEPRKFSFYVLILAGLIAFNQGFTLITGETLGSRHHPSHSIDRADYAKWLFIPVAIAGMGFLLKGHEERKKAISLPGKIP